MANQSIYGLRFHRSRSGHGNPVVFTYPVADDQSFDVNSGGSNCTLGPGDVVRINASGALEQCDGAEDTAETPFAVVERVVEYWDAAKGRMEPSYLLPSDVSYDTNLNRQTKVQVILIEDAIWEIDCDAIAGTGLLSDYQTLVGLNANIILTGATNGGRLTPLLDIGTAGTSNALIWRIFGVSPTKENQDFSAANVKMLVQQNLAQRPGWGGETGL